MPAEQLPGDGELRLGSAALHGQRVRAIGGDRPEVAWATSEPVPGAGRIWLELSGLAAQTGLQRGGNREANHALWRIVITRMSAHPATRAYIERRTPAWKVTYAS